MLRDPKGFLVGELCTPLDSGHLHEFQNPYFSCQGDQRKPAATVGL